MLLSMTGYGKASFDNEKRSVSIEIKSLNSKQTEISLKIPASFREKENEIRQLAESILQRGKIDIYITQDIKTIDEAPLINQQIVISYYRQLKEISDKLSLKEDNLLPTVMRLPETTKNEKQTLKDDEWQHVLVSIKKAINETIEFRKQEGKALDKDLSDRIEKIGDLSLIVKNLETERMEKIKNKLKNNLKETILNGSIDANRFEQELIYYLEKLDISEELSRLKNHLLYFSECMKSHGPIGKKLGFIAQEMGREINTIGSKANDAAIQRIVVDMKDELEKIKEQLMNVL